MEARPKIDVPPRPADKAVDFFAWGALALLWALTIWYLFRLPDTIPVHFNGAGIPDRYGERGSLLALPLVASALFAGLSAVTAVTSKYPQALNYPVAITPANALRQYRGAIRLGRSLRIGMVLVFLLLVYQTAQVATGQAEGLGAWSLPVFIGLLLVPPVLWYWLTVAKAKAA
ncbi:DUF1648 domain-containing protein [Hymenobacter ruricola]|uniref:DUF1648 domain-containing protein n=1 Tax=Hymenobacter ruricola TaxID=2791023 RepID=A0ABS0I1Q6_9BACT|nr:DUF1648 domain-containing protein [Hymenobacter ruricola]MBF9220868.1 DUF1648 domain-containing protein [Hymenobacter ruricola]